MAAEIASERVCYVHCNFCNTILAVSVPSCSNFLTIVTVRCGYCSNLLSVNLGALLQPHFQDFQKQQMVMADNSNVMCEGLNKLENSSGSSSSSSSMANDSLGPFTPRHEPIRPPEKRQRVPSAYNRFIKDEIQRIKASNPTISHREAFSTAAKNWAHFPHINLGWKRESNKQATSKRNNDSSS